MKAVPVIAAGVILFGFAAVAGVKPRRQVPASTLTPGEFFKGNRDWLPQADPALVAGLDMFMTAIKQAGGNAFISPAGGALGRTYGSATSQHHTQPGKPFRAADVMVEGISLQAAFDIARGLNLFSGIGAYPDWNPAPGLHLDTRTDRTPANPATWSGIKVAGNQKYFELSRAFV